jgi:hypothetical protein
MRILQLATQNGTCDPQPGPEILRRSVDAVSTGWVSNVMVSGPVIVEDNNQRVICVAASACDK